MTAPAARTWPSFSQRPLSLTLLTTLIMMMMMMLMLLMLMLLMADYKKPAGVNVETKLQRDFIKS